MKIMDFFACFILQCISLTSKKFVLGSYKCQCKIGNAYPFNNIALYFDGKTVEKEYRLKADGEKEARQVFQNVKLIFAI